MLIQKKIRERIIVTLFIFSWILTPQSVSVSLVTSVRRGRRRGVVSTFVEKRSLETSSRWFFAKKAQNDPRIYLGPLRCRPSDATSLAFDGRGGGVIESKNRFVIPQHATPMKSGSVPVVFFFANGSLVQQCIHISTFAWATWEI